MRRSLIPLLAVLACLSAVPLGATPASAETSVAASSYQVQGSTQRIGNGALPGLRFVATAPLKARVGQEVVVKTWWRDGHGRVYAALQDWGDMGIGSSRPPICEVGERSYGGGSAIEPLTHTWKKAGTYTVRLQVTSGGCSMTKQTRTVQFSVVVS